MRTKISDRNKFIVITFATLNVIAISYAMFFEVQKWFLYSVIAINIIIFFYFTLLNARYWAEFDKLLNSFNFLMRNNNVRIKFPKRDEEFEENARFLSLMKRTYIEHNLLKKDYQDLKVVYEKFIPKKIHDEIGFQRYEKIILWTAITKVYTIMFLDIRWFSNVCEEIHNPYKTLLLLNIYFDGIEDIIEKHNGYIDKYLWDGLLIIFDQENTDDSISASIEIQQFLKIFQMSALGKHIHIGIGINRGSVTLWTIGTKNYMEATIIGQAVNISAWLEQLTRTYETDIIISDTVYDALTNKDEYAITFLTDEPIRGKQKPMKIFTVLWHSPEKVSEEIAKIV